MISGRFIASRSASDRHVRSRQTRLNARLARDRGSANAAQPQETRGHTKTCIVLWVCVRTDGVGQRRHPFCRILGFCSSSHLGCVASLACPAATRTRTGGRSKEVNFRRVYILSFLFLCMCTFGERMHVWTIAPRERCGKTIDTPCQLFPALLRAPPAATEQRMGTRGINAMRLVLFCTVLLAESQGFSSFQAPWTSLAPPLPGHGPTRASVTQRCMGPFLLLQGPSAMRHLQAVERMSKPLVLPSCILAAETPTRTRCSCLQVCRASRPSMGDALG